MTYILRADFLNLAFESLHESFFERENRFLNKLITAFTFCLELLGQLKFNDLFHPEPQLAIEPYRLQPKFAPIRIDPLGGFAPPYCQFVRSK